MTGTRGFGGDGASDGDSSAPSLADAKLLGILSLCWLVAVLVIGIRGETPENDAWAYANSTRTFLETGQIVRSRWTYTPVVTNILWGALFGKVFGLSFATLRLSTLVMGWLGTLLVYVLGRVFGQRRGVSALLAGTAGFSPMALGLSFTFMTDVLFTTLATGSIAAFVYAFRRRSVIACAIGAVAAVLGIVSRQPGVVLLAAPVAALALSRIKTNRALLLGLLAASMFGAIGFIVEKYVFGWSPLGVARIMTGTLQNPALPHFIVVHGTTSLLCLGLASLPVLIWVAASGGVTRAHWFAGAAIGVLAIACVAVKTPEYPLWHNLLDPGGLGPMVLHCARFRPQFPGWVIWMFACIGAFAGGLSLSLVLQWVAKAAWPERHTHPEKLMLLLCVLFYLLPVCARSPFFNRHLIPVVPAWLAMIALTVGEEQRARASLRLGTVAAVLIGLFATLATADYLGNLRLRVALYGPLIERGVAANEIEGGFEFYGQHRYGRDFPRRSDAGQTQPVGESKLLRARTWKLEHSGPSWPSGERFVVSYCPNIAGYQKVAEVGQFRFLPPMRERISLHELSSGATPSRPAMP